MNEHECTLPMLAYRLQLQGCTPQNLAMKMPSSWLDSRLQELYAGHFSWLKGFRSFFSIESLFYRSDHFEHVCAVSFLHVRAYDTDRSFRIHGSQILPILILASFESHFDSVSAGQLNLCLFATAAVGMNSVSRQTSYLLPHDQ